MKLTICKDAYQTCIRVAEKLAVLGAKGGTVALSGGSTPKLLFKIMREQGAERWEKLKFFWGDERIVPAESPESNYGEFYRELVASGIVPAENVFQSPYYPDTAEVLKDTALKIERSVPHSDGLPRFDLILLGVGEDGHTASVFPDNLASFNSEKALEVVKHPASGQKRITLTGSAINNAAEVLFLCTGESKSYILYQVICNRDPRLPATHVRPVKGVLRWYLDEAAVGNINY